MPAKGRELDEATACSPFSSSRGFDQPSLLRVVAPTGGDAVETSIYLAKLIGPIYLVVAVGLLLNPGNARAIVKEFMDSPALFYLSGILALIIGGLIVLLHNVWSGWPIAITLLGWAAILKGVVRLIAPDAAKSVLSKFVGNKNDITAAALLALALGAYFTAMGFWLGPLG
jgi:hypothetical protein